MSKKPIIFNGRRICRQMSRRDRMDLCWEILELLDEQNEKEKRDEKPVKVKRSYRKKKDEQN